MVPIPIQHRLVIFFFLIFSPSLGVSRFLPLSFTKVNRCYVTYPISGLVLGSFLSIACSILYLLFLALQAGLACCTAHSMHTILMTFGTTLSWRRLNSGTGGSNPLTVWCSVDAPGRALAP